MKEYIIRTDAEFRVENGRLIAVHDGSGVEVSMFKEMPEHGTLGDLDILASKVAEAQDQIRGKDYDPFMLLGDVLRWIGLMPTIVEASEGQDRK